MTKNSQDSRSNLTRRVRYNSLASGFSRLLATASLAVGAGLCLPASAAPTLAQHKTAVAIRTGANAYTIVGAIG